MGMGGLMLDQAWRGRNREASRLASEAMALIESIGDATLTVGLSFAVIYAKSHSGEWGDALRWSQRAIDLAHAHPGVTILAKPFGFRELQAALASVLPRD